MNPTRVLEESQIGRCTVRMAMIVNWNGVDVPEELKGLKKGRYVLLPMDEAPDPPLRTRTHSATALPPRVEGPAPR